MKKNIVFLILCQCLIILFLVSYVFKKNSFILGDKISITPMKHQDFLTTSIDGLEKFYEPKPNSTQLIHLDYENTYGPQNPIYTINTDGLNQLTNISVNKTENVFRIAILGDSFTFGAKVNTEDNYPSKLQNLLNTECRNMKYELINLGVGGYDIQYSVKRYKVKGQKYNPDLIIWLVLEDDLYRLNEKLIPKLLHIQYNSEKKGTNKKNLGDNYNNYYSLWKNAKDEVVSEMGGKEKMMNLQKQYFEELNKYSNKRKLIFTFSGIAKENKSFLESLKEKNNNYFFIDKLRNISTIPKAILPDGHPSPHGHKIIADDILHYLIKENVIDCQKK